MLQNFLLGDPLIGWNYKLPRSPSVVFFQKLNMPWHRDNFARRSDILAAKMTSQKRQDCTLPPFTTQQISGHDLWHERFLDFPIHLWALINDWIIKLTNLIKFSFNRQSKFLHRHYMYVVTMRLNSIRNEQIIKFDTLIASRRVIVDSLTILTEPF